MRFQRISADEIIEKLTQPPDEAEEPVYKLRRRSVAGELDLKHRTIEFAVDIQGCEFLDEVDLRYCEFKQAVDFSGCTFVKSFNSGDGGHSHTTYRKDLICKGAVFKGPTTFNFVKCTGCGYFTGTIFEGEEGADFTDASFGGILECSNTTFRGPVSFSALECADSALFNPATFEGEVYFTHASVGRQLNCRGAIFNAKANFGALECGGSAHFNPATFEGEWRPTTFEGEVDFTYASFETTFNCREAIFNAKADFGALKCGGSAFFNPATFQGEVDFSYASFKRGLTCWGANFERDVGLYRTEIGALSLGNALPFKQHSRVDLRECQFDRFEGSPSVAREMAQKQKPDEFSRDPYIQLEKYYRGVGNDLQAKEMHLQGRSELRKNAWRRGRRTAEWPLRTKLADALIWLLTGYGVKTGRLFILIIILILLGTRMFWAENTLKPARADTSPTLNENQNAEILFGSVASKQEKSEPFWPHLLERGSYSLDLFLPLVNLHIDENWRPNGPWLELYALFHGIIGWVLVPLLLTSLAGIIRRE